MATLAQRTTVDDTPLPMASPEVKAFNYCPPDVVMPLAEITPLLTCGICKGYVINATTITECLHTFCRSCIVKHVDFRLHCPTCYVLIHPTNPLVNLRLDCTRQDIVYKLLPHLESDERKREAEFYKSRGLPLPQSASKVRPTSKQQPKYMSQWAREKRVVCVALHYVGSSASLGCYMGLSKKFIRVPDYTSVGHIQAFLRKKLALQATCQAVLFFNIYLLHESVTLIKLFSLLQQNDDEIALLELDYGIVPRRNYFSEYGKADSSESETSESVAGGTEVTQGHSPCHNTAGDDAKSNDDADAWPPTPLVESNSPDSNDKCPGESLIN